jgi:16S rRNA (cytosine1402-N4)-methyltransferase
MTNLKNLQKLHKPVLLTEVLEAFELTDNNLALSNKRVKIIDATVGLGGHTEQFINRGASVLGIDEDKGTLELVKKRLILTYRDKSPSVQKACPTPEDKLRGSYKLINANFKDIYEIAEQEDFLNADGILFDLGVSSPQITSNVRGISFQEDSAPLDMRLDAGGMAVKGSDLLNILRADQLRELFSKVLNIKKSRDLTNKIIEFRKFKQFETVGDFKKVIGKVIFRKGKKSPDTLPFLALRIAVNSELENLREGLSGGLKVLRSSGKMIVISFHSGEDSLVKQIFIKFEAEELGRILTKKPIIPKTNEIISNIRSRSALMRIFQKNEKKPSNQK